MNLLEIGCEIMAWIQLIQDRIQLKAFQKMIMKSGFYKNREPLIYKEGSVRQLGVI
jgi:hypothetical protein